MTYSRYALYHVPPVGALADFGAAWLGWDVVRGCDADQPDVAGVRDITATPRKYGFHGTLKPPFRLKGGVSFEDLHVTAAQVAAKTTPAHAEGVQLTQIGRFLALTPIGATDGLRRVAEAAVRGLDAFRAPPTEAELTRRRAAGLSPRQDALLREWGYPYVMDEFRFHLTLSGALEPDTAEAWKSVVANLLPPLPKPFEFTDLALCGERADGRFEMIQRFPLKG